MPEEGRRARHGSRPRSVSPERSWIALLGLASGLSSFGMASVVPALPLLGRTLQVPFGALQLIVSAYLLGLGLSQPLHGLLADRLGRRPVLLTGFALFGLASVAAVFAQSLATLVAARFLQAIGVSVGTVCGRAIVRDTHEPEAGAVALAFISAVMGISPVLAPLIGGLVTDAWGWRALFVAHTVAAVLVFTWMALVLPETRPPETRVDSPREMLASFALLLRDRGFLGYTLSYGSVTAIGFAFLTVGATLFGELFGMSGSAFGVLWAFLAFSYAIGSWSAARASRRFGPAPVLRRGAQLMLAGCVLYLLAAFLPAPLRALYVTALVVIMVAQGVVSPIALAGAVAGHPERAGAASGLSSALAMLMGMLFSALSGLLFDHAASTPGWLMLASAVIGSLAVASALSVPARPGRRRRRSTP